MLFVVLGHITIEQETKLQFLVQACSFDCATCTSLTVRKFEMLNLEKNGSFLFF